MIDKRTLLRTTAFGAAAAIAQTGTAGAEVARTETAAEPRTGITERARIAADALVFGLPIVTNYAVMYEYTQDRGGSQFKVPLNTIWNDAQVFTPADTAIPTPNSDTPYSLFWADLRAEPVVVTVPDVPAGRYFSVMLCDGNTYNYGYIGSRATGQQGGSWMVVGPRWQGTPPPGIKGVFRSSTDFSILIFRTQLFNPADLPNVVAIQAGYRGQPLSAFLGRRPPPPPAPVAFPRINADLAKHHFFEYLDFALRFSPPQPREREMRQKLARIGIGTGRPFRPSFLERIELDVGALIGNRRVEQAVANAGINMNNWRVTPIPGSAEAYDGNWLLRAVATKVGIYGNSTEEATYPFTRTDSTGQTLDGSRHRYTITFPPGQLPPVNAFWSVTMYDGHTQLLVANPINRYLINTPMLPNLKRNPDGGLTIYVQRESPGAELESNWLPAPNGPIYLVLRLYWPKTEQPALLPIGQGQWRPPGVVRVA